MTHLEEVIIRIIDATRNNQISWSTTSSNSMIMTIMDDTTFTIECCVSNQQREFYLCEWDDKGDKVTDTSLMELSHKEKNLLVQLYEQITRHNPEIIMTLETLLKSIEHKMEKKVDNISYFKLAKRLGFETENSPVYIQIRENKEKSFYVNTELDNKFVQPLFSQLETLTGYTEFNDAEIVLIAAPGATGKSTLSKYLSASLQIPILDLGLHGAVGVHSLVGLLFDSLSPEDMLKYQMGLMSGTGSLIIDGLDEATTKASQEGIEGFLDDIIRLSKGAKGLPFVILGRSKALEDACLYIETNGVKVSFLQIEPFTIEKAKLFIDKQQKGDSSIQYENSYKEVRDYIIDAVGGFFRNESEMNHRLYEHFIGYAPVLLSISRLLNNEDSRNYYALLNELQNSRKRNVELVIDIIERILDREQKKIREQAMPQLLQNLSSDLAKVILDKAFGRNEQCARLLHYILDVPFEYAVCDIESINRKYEEIISEWIKNHPFLLQTKKELVSIVFESYIVSSLSNDSEYSELVYTYLTVSRSNSYLLFDIYRQQHEENPIINYRMLQPVYSSFKALDRGNDKGTMELLADWAENKDSDKIKCCVTFSRLNSDEEVEFNLSVSKDSVIEWGSFLSDVIIDAPLSIAFTGNNTILKAPLNINCKKIIVDTPEISIQKSSANTEQIILECEELTLKYSQGNLTRIVNKSGDKTLLTIYSQKDLSYPFIEYRGHVVSDIADSEDFSIKYQKLRRAILMFRSHSKGVLARVGSKIENRICNVEVGKRVIDALFANKVLYKDEYMYYINPDKLAMVLGVKYDDVRSCVVNEKIRVFLNNV